MRFSQRWPGLLAGLMFLMIALTAVLAIRQNWQAEELRHESTHSLLLLSQFRSSLGNSHLWLEEFLIARNEENLRRHQQSLRDAREHLQYLGQYIEGHHGDRFPAAVKSSVAILKVSIGDFARQADQRLHRVNHATADSSLDEQFDRLYMGMMQRAEQLGEAVSRHIDDARRQQDSVQRATLLTDLVLLMFALLLIALMWYRYRQARQREQLNQQALQSSEQRFRAFFEDSPVALKEEDHTGVKRLLDELDASDRQNLRQYLNHHPEFVRQCATAIRISHANAEAVRLYGYDNADELMRSNIQHLQQAAQQQALIEKILMLVEGSASQGQYVHMQDHQGGDIHAMMRLRVLEADDWSRVVVSLMDISTQITVQQQLDDANRHLRQAQSIARIGSWELDFSTSALKWSDEVYDIFGLPTAMQPSYDAFLRAIHVDDRERVDAAWKAHLEQQKDYRVIHRIVRPDGQTLYVEERCDTRRDRQGKPLIALGTVQDVTRLLQAEAQMHMLQQVFHSVTDLIGIMDHRYRLVYGNQALRELLGISEHTEPASIDLNRSFPADEVTRLQQDILPLLARTGHWQGEVCMQHPQQGLRHISLILQRHQDARHHDIQQFSMIGRDISDDKIRQEKLEHMQRLESLGVLAGGIAHDFNNLLTAIMGHAFMARERYADHTRLIEHLDGITRSSNSAADLCRQMLAYSGKGKFVIEHIHLSELVREMTRLLSVSIPKHISLQCDLEASLPAVAVDIAQLQQVVMNLVINAGEAIGENPGTISLRTGVCNASQDYLQTSWLDDHLAAGTYVYLEVTDTGCGMTDEVKSRLFEPFFTTKFTGRGLGMSAILGIVRGHQGTIRLYSEPGKGSCFKVLLPASENKPGVLPATEEEKPIADEQFSGTILIVDDEESIRQVAALTVRQMGFSVLEACDGIEAVACYRAHQSDIVCVLLDMTMPRMGGEDTFSALRQINPEVQVILSSGYNAQTATQRFVGKKLAGFIQKPYTPAALQQQLRETLAT